MKKMYCILGVCLWLTGVLGACVSLQGRTAGIGKRTARTEGMVYLPGGICIMGGSDGDPDERPVHEVYVEPFYIDVHEVTVSQYAQFLTETGHPAPAFWQPELDRPDDPVVGITWFEAVAYAAWAGKRLPTEAEWEYAARGGSPQRSYPGGHAAGSTRANVATFGITPVKSYVANHYGLYDMIGNVWEWCGDWYDRDFYNVSPFKNPQGPVTGTHKVLRGGAWYCDPREARAANRYYAVPDSGSFHVGFRCAVSGR